MDGLFIMQLFRSPAAFVLTVIGVMFSICVHEWCHARVALAEGDDTASRLGYLTFNPLVVMGWQSLVVLLFFGLAFGRVPVNVGRLRHRWSAALVSAAGPLANLGLSLSFLVLMRLLVFLEVVGGLGVLLSWSRLNLLLMVFNLLPVPPLDGWGVLEGVAPQWTRRLDGEKRGVMFFVLFGLLTLPVAQRLLDGVVDGLLKLMVEALF